MAPGFLTSDGGKEILGLDRRLVVVVVALVAVVAVGGAAAMLMFGGDDHESNAQLDSVPSDVDGVVYVDGDLVDDELTQGMVDEGIEVGWWFVDSSDAPDIEVLLETLDTENIDYEDTTVFLQGPEEDQADYAGSVVNLGEDSEADEMVELLEAEVGADQLREDTYNGVDIHEVDVVEAAQEADVEGVTDELDVTSILTEFIGVETTAWVATPDENTVILGSDEAAADAIDVHQGDADPIDDDLREAHEVSKPGPVEATVSPDVIDEPIVEVAGVISDDVAAMLNLAGHEPEYVSLTYDVRDHDDEIVTFDVLATMEDEGAADDLFNALDTFADPDVALEERERISEESAVDRAAGEQDGKYLHLEVPTLPTQAATYVAQFVDAYGPTPEPVELVPERADGIQTIERNATSEEPTSDLVDAMLANGLLGDDADQFDSVEALREAIDADDVTYNSTTTFYSDDDPDYVGTYVELDGEGPNDFIESTIRSEYAQLSDDDIGSPDREHEEGYRHVDVYEVDDLDDEMDVTRALSGFVADGTTEWISPISDNSFVFGSEEAVKDVADIYRGASGPAETPLHEAHNQTDGQIRLSGAVADKPVDGYADAVDGELGDALAGEDVEVLSVAYSTGEPGEMNLDIQLRGSDGAAADDLADALGAVVDDEPDPSAEPVHERAGLHREGESVHLTVPYDTDKLVGDAGAFVEAFGPELFPDGG